MTRHLSGASLFFCRCACFISFASLFVCCCSYAADCRPRFGACVSTSRRPPVTLLPALVSLVHARAMCSVLPLFLLRRCVLLSACPRRGRFFAVSSFRSRRSRAALLLPWVCVCLLLVVCFARCLCFGCFVWACSCPFFCPLLSFLVFLCRLCCVCLLLLCGSLAGALVKGGRP